MSASALTRIQGGLETTFLTAVAANRILYVRKAELPTEDRGKEYIEQSRQSYNAFYEGAETHVIGGWKAELDFSFDDMHWWYNMMLGAITPGGVGPYTWTKNSEATSDDLKAMTLEAADNVAAVEMPGTLVTDWEIDGKDGEGPNIVTAKLGFLGQKVDSTTMTGALSHRDLRGTYMMFKDTAFYIDDTAGGIGTTQVAAALMAFNIKCNNNIVPIHPGNNNGLMMARERGTRYVEWSAELLLNATTLTEFTDHYKDNDMRFVQFKNSGGGANDDWIFNIATKLHMFPFKRNEAVRRVVLAGRSIYDATLGYAWSSTITNDEASI